MRIRRRSASRSLPCRSSSASRCWSSSSIVTTARAHALVAGDVMRGREDRLIDDLVVRRPRRSIGSNIEIRSTVSPHHSMRYPACSYGGKTSRVSPLTRKVPRARLIWFRWYWMSTSRCIENSSGTSVPLVQPEQLPLVLLGRAEAVDARDARDDEHVAPRQQRGGRRMSQPLDLVVDRRVLLDVGVGVTGCTPRVGSSRSSSRSTRPRCRGRTRGTRSRAARPATCSGAITRVGRWSRSTTWAIVKVLPVPVAPRSVTCGTPAATPSTMPSIACG